MSIKLMTIVWDMVELSPGEKLVLLSLADQANDQGTHCYPSVETICRRSGQKERTVRRILTDLETAGHITRQWRSGTSTQYRVHPCQNGTPAKMAPLPNRQESPANLAPDPCQIGTLTVTEPSIKQEPPNPLGRGSERAAIPDEWVLPDIGDLPPDIGALAKQWPAGAYRAEGAAFHQHWRGRGTKRKDWAASWAARVQAQHPAIIRAGKAGVPFAAAAAATAVPVTVAPVTAKKHEDARSADLHQALIAVVGEAVWSKWFEPAALIFRDDGLVVVASSAFQATQIEQIHRRSIMTALTELNRGAEWIRFEHAGTTARRACA